MTVLRYTYVAAGMYPYKASEGENTSCAPVMLGNFLVFIFCPRKWRSVMIMKKVRGQFQNQPPIGW